MGGRRNAVRLEERIIRPLYKKGIKWTVEIRRISLLNIAYNILSRVLHSRLFPHVDDQTRKYHRDFHHGRSTVGQV
jgi:hypothetical protein